jgi:hypothetical protein
MSAKDILAKKLNEIIALEEATPIEILSGYVVGELLGDYDSVYTELNETDPTVQRIGDLASDLEVSNGNLEELQRMWRELKVLIEGL